VVTLMKIPIVRMTIWMMLAVLSVAHAADQDASPTPAGPRDLGKVLCLGDSVTECRGDNGTWRYGLWKRLLEHAYQFDFIGTQRHGDCARSTTPDYMGENFDHDHEGHGGWTTSDILHGKDDNPGQKLGTWLQDYTPDTVLLHIGGNDLQKARNKPWAVLGIVKDAQENVRQIIHMLQADNPQVTIYLALHIKVNPDKVFFGNGGIALFNSGLPNIAREMTTEQSRIILVDHNTGWENVYIDDDGIHPNAAGNERMAEVWFDTIHEGPRQITVQPPLASCAPHCHAR
jgi:lysophospholipase L1-like esterase